METGDERCCFNGVDGATGAYVSPPATPDELARLAFGSRFERRPDEHAEAALRDKLRFFHDRATQRSLGPREGVDPCDLAQAGWGVIFASRDAARSGAVREALGELLALRREQCGPRYREYAGADAYRAGERADGFLARHGVGPGPAQPDRVPYYLLLVGDPEAIPYRFQYELDVQYAVGRVAFDTLDGYAAYARSVAAAERGQVRLPRRVALFAPQNPDDRATRTSAARLVAPLAGWARARTRADPSPPPWEVVHVEGAGATKARLGELLGGAETPALLFTAAHGLGFPAEDPRQALHQGALLCQDWPGPVAWSAGIPEAFYLAADDVGDGARLLGLIAFYFGCYSVGTPLWDPFAKATGGGPRQVAPQPFLARLPQRLAGHPRGGALAIVGHVERTMGFSFAWPGAGAQTATFESALDRLLQGQPVGWALEYFNARYAELSTKLGNELDDVDNGASPDPFRLADLWTSNNDARGFVLFGDPAVRLAVAPARAAGVDAPAEIVAPPGTPSSPDADAATVALAVPAPRGAGARVGTDAAPAPGQQRGGAHVSVLSEQSAELEIAFHAESLLSQEVGIYTAELRFTQAGGDVVRPPVWGAATFDFDRLLAVQHLPAAYGELLSGFLREPVERRDLFRYARDAAALSSHDLRVRLFIGPSAPELHRLRWEMLVDPESGAPLFTDPHRPFSRLLGSYDLRPVGLRPRGRLRALTVIASPSDLGRYCPDGGATLPPIDVAGALGTARTGLGDLEPTELASGGAATLDGMLAELRSGADYDILFLVCHGTLRDARPLLWLERPDGTADVVSGRDFVQRVCELPHPPRLVVLSSCQSAGQGAVELVHAIGPSLASAGIPAVVAMQGDISEQTARAFLEVMFQQLRADGRIDRAVAVARGAVRGRPDWWTPVLFLRIASGAIWYVPGSGDREFDKWPALLGSIRSGRTLPILGTGVLESLLGDRREQTRSWAEAHGFPGAPIQEEDLPNVAQFLSVVQADDYLRDTLYVAGLRGRAEDRLSRLRGERPPRGRRERDAALIDEVVRRAGRELRGRDADDPHRVLASLPLPLYVTTNPDDLLFDALAEAGKAPEREYCRWTRRAELPPGVYEREPGFEPTAARPLVYYLFGHLSDPVSVVLTIDDYLDHLLAVAQDPDLIPKVVRGAMAKRALLFLGFRTDDWDFRALFRLIMNQPGGEARRRFAHIAAQLEPDDGRVAVPERARQYQEQYFGHENITIYWGTVERFAADLAARCRDAVEVA